VELANFWLLFKTLEISHQPFSPFGDFFIYLFFTKVYSVEYSPLFFRKEKIAKNRRRKKAFRKIAMFLLHIFSQLKKKDFNKF